MLKRRKRIAKYISALQKNKLKLSSADVQKFKLQQPQIADNQTKQKKKDKSYQKGVSIPRLTFQNKTQEDSNIQEEVLWQDSQDQEVHLGNKNMFKKLQLNQETTQKAYQSRLKKFYASKYGVKNWAVQGEGEYQYTVKQMLDQQQIYVQSKRKIQRFSIDFIGRTTEKHDSIVTGIDFKNNVIASCGLDQKLKIWSLKSEQTNPQMRLSLEKDVYTQQYSLNGCFFKNHEVILSTLRQNYLIVDTNKWKIKFVGSSFLNEHKTFQNMRINGAKDNLLMFSDNKISILDEKNVYAGSLLANQQLLDVQFGSNHDVYGVSNDVFYHWDLRMWRLIKNSRKCLGYTKLWNHGQKIGTGSKLGIVRLYNDNQNDIEEYAQIDSLVTHVTDLKGNKDGSLLLQASKWKPNAIRLIDTNRGKCIPGWPTNRTKVGLATATNFSNNQQFCIGNSHGYLTFFKLQTQK